VVRDGLPPQKKLNTYGYMFEILDSLNTGRRKQEDAHVGPKRQEDITKLQRRIKSRGYIEVSNLEGC